MNSIGWSERDTSVAQRFATVAGAVPDGIAIRSPARSLTYAELNSRANAVGHIVKTASDGPEPLIAVLVSGSVAAIEAMLGVLKAGAGYLVIDPSQPEARSRLLVAAAQPVALLTDATLHAAADRIADDLPILTVPETGDAVRHADLVVPVEAERLAAVYYTSGSSGEPKGIEWDQRFVLHQGQRQAEVLGLSPRDRYSHTLPEAYAASAIDIYAPLLNGCALCTFDINESGLQSLGSWLSEARITVFHPSVSVFRRFTAHLEEALSLPDLEWVIVGGDTLYRSDIQQFFDRVDSDAAVISRLAQTEVGPLAELIVRNDTDLRNDVVPVGPAVADKEVWAQDQYGERLGSNEIGELLVCSRFLARGYRNSPDATRQAFTESADGRTVFASGDIGRVRADGTIERHGRTDRQVKIRGHRVEMDEVERALVSMSMVRQAAVVAVEEASQEKNLAAFLVWQPGEDAAVSDARAGLAETLPLHMVPRYFNVLDELPVTDRGKVDRKSLELDRSTELTPSERPPAPSDPLEEQILRIWERCFDLTGIDTRDNFFELGGDSLIALEISLEIARTMDDEVPVALLIEAPTVEQLAARLGAGTAQRLTSVVPIQPHGSKPPFFCVPPAGRTALVFRELAHHLGSEQPFLSFAHAGLDPMSEPDPTVEAMAARYLTDLRSVQPAGPYRIGGMCFGGLVAFEMASRLLAQGEEVALLAILDTRLPPGQKASPQLQTLPQIWRRRTRRYLRRAWYLALRATHPVRHGYVLYNVRRTVSRALSVQDDTPKPAPAYVLQYAQQTMRSHRHARDSYQPSAYPRTVDLFVTTGSDGDDEMLEAWSATVDQALSTHEIPGVHDPSGDAFIREPHVKELARQLREVIDAS